MKFEPGAKLGPYQILGELGRGGMATVYRAYRRASSARSRSRSFPNSSSSSPASRRRFHREAVAVARLQHPNIPCVYDHGEQDGVTYIVSEYVEGGTLCRAWVRRFSSTAASFDKSQPVVATVLSLGVCRLQQ